MNEDSCQLCLEKFEKGTVVSLECCSKQRIHIECYVKSLPRCPFCRAEQPRIFPIFIMKNDWPTMTKRICAAIMFSTCVAIAVLSGACNSTSANQKEPSY